MYALPEFLKDIYAQGDEIKFANFPGQMIPFAQSLSLERAAFEPSVYDSWPFFYHNDFLSDEIAVIVHGPATGFVMQRKHDGQDKMLAPSVAEFFEGLASDPPSEDVFDYEDEGWIYPRALTPQDREAVDALLAAVPDCEDSYEGESLAALAMSMMEDDEFVARFGSSLFSIENFRAIIWGRLMRIDSDAARVGVAMYEADYEARSKR